MECSVEFCDRPRRSSGVGLCEGHYYQRRRGKPFTPLRRRKPTSTPCEVDGCDESGFTGRWCPKHEARIRRHGDPNAYTPHRERGYRRWDASPMWTGDEATASAIHQRLASIRGKASAHRCVGCGGQAAHWSYNHDDPDERWSDEVGRERWYSVKLDYYSPRCVSCHKRYDLAVAERRRSERDRGENAGP